MDGQVLTTINYGRHSTQQWVYYNIDVVDDGLLINTSICGPRRMAVNTQVHLVWVNLIDEFLKHKEE